MWEWDELGCIVLAQNKEDWGTGCFEHSVGFTLP